MTVFPAFVGTIPGWITAGGMVGLLGVLLRVWLKRTAMTIALENGIRDHYSHEVEALRRQLSDITTHSSEMLTMAEKRYAEAIEASSRRHLECEKECERLRERVRAMEDLVSGMHQQIRLVGNSALRLFETRGDLDPAVREALRTLEQAAVVIKLDSTQEQQT